MIVRGEPDTEDVCEYKKNVNPGENVNTKQKKLDGLQTELYVVRLLL